MPKVNQQGIAHILIILLLLIAAVALGVYLVQTKTNILPHAASGPINPRTAFSFSANTNSIKVGEELNVDVMVSSDFDAANTFTAKIVYDPSKLEVVRISPEITDTASSSGFFIKKWIEQTDDKKGSIILSGAVPNPGYKTTAGNPGKMATIKLKGKTVSQAAIGYDWAGSAIYRNSDNLNILGSTDAWGVNITPAASGIPNVDTDKDGFLDKDELFYGTNPAKACGANAWPPDLNDDTSVNGGDVSLLAPFISGNSQRYSKRYDLNQDGKINQDDVSVIQIYFLKSCSLSSPTPTPTPTPSGVPLTVKVFSPNGGEAFKVGDKVAISWLSSGADYCTPMYIYKTDPERGIGGRALANGDTLKITTDSYTWFIPDVPGAPTDLQKIVVSCYKAGATKADSQSVTDESDVFFTVAPSVAPPVVDGKRADLFKDSKKPDFVNDQDISVFFTKCAEKGVELFGQPASRQPICDILNDGKITVQDWAILIKFRNQAV